MSGNIHIKESKRVRIPAEDLTPGMYVAELDIPWLDSPFLFQGFTVDNWDDVYAVREVSKYVTVDVARQVKIRLTPKEAARKNGFATMRRFKREAPAEKEIPRANGAYRQTSTLIRGIMDDVRLGKSIDTPAAKEAVSECVDSIIRNPDGMLLLTRIKHKDEYTAEHSLNVSILSIAFGRALGLDRERLEELGMAGMLHDVGKILTPTEVLNKEGRLNDEEFQVMKRHPLDGRDVLLSSGADLAGALDVAQGHHEWLNGTGYPHGRFDHQLTLWTKMVAITDAFDAITSDRCYQQGRTNMDAFRILNKERGTHFDSKLVMKFIGSVGIYAPGSLVQLNNDVAGMVIESNPKAALKPKVMILRDKNGRPIPPKLVDLSAPFGTAKQYHITSMVKAHDYNIDLEKLQKEDFLLGAMVR